MSPRPLSPCAEHGCYVLVQSGRCPAHQRERPKDPEQKHYYSSRQWRTLSEMVRREEPICTVCKRVPSQQTHHINGDWRDSRRENLAGICNACHRQLSGSQHKKKAGK